MTPDNSLDVFIKDDNDKKLFYADKEHYTLLSMVSKEYNNTVLYDIGSYKGLSAIALSSNKSNLVVSYDIEYLLKVNRPDNVEFRIGNFYNDKQLLNSPLIMFDIDPHDGLQEKEFVRYLTSNNYKGSVIFDDIHLNDGMKDFWNSVTQQKQDYTKLGHWSGTGVVHFT
jgi:hypothetical protein